MHDPGGKALYPLQPDVTGNAFISDDGLHRIWLSRSWASPPIRFALFIGTNPSTARHDVDDPTVRRELDFTRQWGLNGYFKVNVATYRATNPKSLLDPPCVVHPDNVATIRRMALRADRVVLAYGALIPKLQPIADQLVAQLRTDKIQLYCLGRTKQGHPRHPLYLAKTTVLELFE